MNILYYVLLFSYYSYNASYILLVCWFFFSAVVGVLNVLCSWFCFNIGGKVCVFLIGFHFLQCSEYWIMCISVCHSCLCYFHWFCICGIFISCLCSFFLCYNVHRISYGSTLFICGWSILNYNYYFSLLLYVLCV